MGGSTGGASPGKSGSGGELSAISAARRGELVQGVVPGVVAADHADAAVADDPQRHDRVLDQRRLVHARGGEARQAGALGLDEDVGLVAVERGERALRELEALAHARTPTCTSRKRPGAAPCETCACWPGWPLPQFVSPVSTHSSGPATPSSEPQKTGVTPV